MIRGFLKAITVFVLFFSFLILGISWNLSSSLSYNNVENNAAGVALNLMNSQMNLTQQIDNNLPLLKQYCQQTNKQEISLNYQGYNLSISCSDANLGASQLINDTLKNIIHGIYYTHYTCSYWNCFNTAQNGIPLFLISEMSQKYWNKIFWYSLAISIIFTALTVFLSKKKESSPITVGITLAAGALPLLGIQKATSLLPKTVSGVSSIFFSQSENIFWKMIIIAGSLILIGIILAILGKVLHIFDKLKKNTEEKEVKEIIKKEKTQESAKGIKGDGSDKNSKQKGKK